MKALIVGLLLTLPIMSQAGSAPKFDAKLSKDAKIEKCAAWAKGEVKGISDAKKKASEFKQNCQVCSSANGIDGGWAFSGKYKP